MKSNFVKYIFIIFVVIIIVFVIYKLTNNKTDESEGQATIEQTESENEIIKEISLGIAEFDTINPILSKNKYIQEITKIIYEPLLELDSEYKIQNCLASEWAKTSETTYLIKLKNDIKWSNGENLTADDVLFTIDILKKIPSIYAYNVQYVTKVDKIDTQSLQITIDHEIPFFEYNLIFPIMNKNYYEGQDFSTTEKNNAPIGTGKYKIVQNDANQITLEKNENYSRSELTLEKIVIGKYGTLSELYNAFKLGKVDLITTNNINIEDYIGTLGYNKKEARGREYDFIAINTQNSILSNKEVRKAMAYTINGENIVANIFNSKYKTTGYPLDFGSWLKGEAVDYSYNIEKARQTLQENGWEYKYNRWQKTENYSTKSINTLRLVVQSTNQTRLSVAETIKTNLEELGIKITIVKASDAQYQNYLQNKNYDMILTGTTVSASPNLDTYFGTNNLANYTNEEITTLLNECKNITKDDLLKEKYARIREIYNDELPYIGLYSSYYAVMSGLTLRGNIEANWYNIFSDIDNWYKE